jgi:hypothetical protein
MCGLSQSYPGIWIGRLKNPTKYLSIFESLDVLMVMTVTVTWLMCIDVSEHTRTFSGRFPFVGSSQSSSFPPNT